MRDCAPGYVGGQPTGGVIAQRASGGEGTKVSQLRKREEEGMIDKVEGARRAAL